jgi:hypothetical protein
LWRWARRISLACFAIAPLVFLGFQNEWRHLPRLTLLINGDERYIRAARVAPLPGENILGENLHADFHRSAEDTIDAGFQDDQLPDANGVAKVEVVHRSRHHVTHRVAMGGNRSRDVNQVHHAAAEDVAEDVRVVGKDDFDHL